MMLTKRFTTTKSFILNNKLHHNISQPSHTSLIGSIWGCSQWYIPDTMYTDFLMVIAKDIFKGAQLYINECATATFPLYFDLDFRAESEDHLRMDMLSSVAAVHSIISILFKHTYSKEERICVVSTSYDACKITLEDGTEIFKKGIHIHYPYILADKELAQCLTITLGIILEKTNLRRRPPLNPWLGESVKKSYGIQTPFLFSSPSPSSSSSSSSSSLSFLSSSLSKFPSTEVLDTGVYNVGLRMLYCRKGMQCDVCLSTASSSSSSSSSSPFSSSTLSFKKTSSVITKRCDKCLGQKFIDKGSAYALWIILDHKGAPFESLQNEAYNNIAFQLQLTSVRYVPGKSLCRRTYILSPTWPSVIETIFAKRAELGQSCSTNTFSGDDTDRVYFDSEEAIGDFSSSLLTTGDSSWSRSGSSKHARVFQLQQKCHPEQIYALKRAIETTHGKEIVPYIIGATYIKNEDESFIYFVKTCSRKCEFVKREHRSSQIYFVVNKTSIARKCFSKKVCTQYPPSWRPHKLSVADQQLLFPTSAFFYDYT